MPKDAAIDDAAAARAEVFNALHQEMELADYARGASGQKVRKLPRNQAPERASKRKALQQADMMEMAIEADDDYEEGGNTTSGESKKRRKRLRGSKVAFKDVVLKSMPLANKVKRKDIVHEKNAPKDIENVEDEEEILKEVAALGIDLDPDDNFEDGDEEDGSDNDDDPKKSGGEDDDGEDDDQDEIKTKTVGSQGISSGGNARVKVGKTGLIQPAKRVMHRLRDFTSQRLAQKHGEAIGAHIRGMSETAVQKLREVAKSAPGAPQVYSSLGMVFESMLTEVEGGDAREQGEGVLGEKEQLKRRFLEMERRLELAQKAYGSYHVAALLCKRDFVLWERSGDAAIKVAQIYSEFIDMASSSSNLDSSVSEEAFATDDTGTLGFDPQASPEKWRSDRKVWLKHALSAYQSSDNLRPPGVDIPCKLAQVHMSLGSYIDALTILTDLRHRVSVNGSGRELGRSEMEGSYPCWLLYADLMMKIGFECKQWNETGLNQNYMFKRWLRKNSKGFDWKERRLQALCLAMEAAAGSASCTKQIKWMKERAEKCLDKSEKEDSADGNAADNDSEEANENSTIKDAANSGNTTYEPHTTNITYAEERVKLLNMNKVEISNFDRMTKAMNLVAGSHIFKNRITARAALLEKHRNAIKELAMRNYGNPEPTANTENPHLSEDELSSKALPLQGSFATVYDIAALLLRQCIHMKLFEGGLLAVQSVLDYSKERASRNERKMELQRENALLQKTGQGLVQSGFKYDQINFESDDSDEEFLGAFISDEEDLEQPGALQSLKSGKLPTDIRAMQAICMLGTGGQDYVALNYVEEVLLSNELDSFDNGDVNQDNMSQWMTFSKSFDGPINKSFLLASIANFVYENARPRPQSYRVLQIFRKHLKLENNQGLDQILSSPKEFERTQALKLLLAALKLMTDCARMDLTSLDEPGKKEAITVEKAVTDSIFVLKIMTRFHHILWAPRFSDWSLPQPSIDMIGVFPGAISILVQAVSLVEDKSLLDPVRFLVGFEQSRDLISTICHADNTTPKPSATSSVVETWQSFPLTCSWQNSFHEKISLRAHNLCVACCVSSFSGWEPSEFNLDQLRSSDMNFFGVCLEGPCVAAQISQSALANFKGFLPKRIASVMTEQWDHIAAILPDIEVLSFESHLEERKKLSWYQKIMKNMEKQNVDPNKISLHGEENGLVSLLAFSSLCLIAAEQSEGDDERDEFVKLSMSVLLPITQFSIDKQVWHSAIGTAAISVKNETKVGYYLDENCQYHGPTKTKQGRIQYANKPTPRVPRPSSKELVEKPARKHQPANAVRVPASALLEEWKQDDEFVERKHSLEDAKRAMKKVDDAMKNLRKCRTMHSLEQASTDVSVALLGVATHDECNNPFLCLQQAAMFAAMGAKRGSNDDVFKRYLPLKHLCTPLEALNILGRADCLRAIHFLHEAQYLCTWIASVCCSRRDQLNEDMLWNSRWKVVGILTYIVSANIDDTGDALSQDNSNAGALRKWDEAAKEEFSRGESDALALVKVDQIQATTINAPVYRENLPMESRGPENQMSVSPDQGEINGMNHHFEKAQPYSYEEQLIEPEIEDVAEDGDDYDPFAGVQVVGI
ncbi:hypothetical protein ACHAXR_012410 [Thalassiosira sp. AJA248-18]